MDDDKFVVLVHGLGHGAWCWERVEALLVERGIRSRSVELPLTSLAEDVETVEVALRNCPSPAVLVGHSYGGMVASGAGHSASRLVFIASMVPEHDEDILALVPRFPFRGLEESAMVSDDGMSISFAPEYAVEALYNCCDHAQAAEYVRRLRPSAASVTHVPLGVEPAWKTVASTYVLCARDRQVSPDLQRYAAIRANSKLVVLDTDHSAMLSRPEELTGIIARSWVGS